MIKKLIAEFRKWSVEFYEQSGCPKEVTTDKVVELAHSRTMCDWRGSLCDIARQKGISFGAVQSLS